MTPNEATLQPKRVGGIIEQWVVSRRPFSDDLEERISRDRLSQVFANADVVIEHPKDCGAAAITRSSWESEMLGTTVGRLSIVSIPGTGHEDSLVDRVLLAASEKRFRLLVARVDARDTHVVHVLESRGFRLMESLVTLRAEVPSTDHAAISARPLRDTDVTSIGEIARNAFATDHYHADPRLPKAVSDSLYENWAVSICNRAADAVLVVNDRDSGNVAGFITCVLHRSVSRPTVGAIDLVAVSSTSQGRGHGRTLVATAIRWFAEHGATHVEVGTQVSNTVALMLYQKMGFRVCRFCYTYHHWLDDPSLKNGGFS